MISSCSHAGPVRVLDSVSAGDLSSPRFASEVERLSFLQCSMKKHKERKEHKGKGKKC